MISLVLLAVGCHWGFTFTVMYIPFAESLGNSVKMKAISVAPFSNLEPFSFGTQQEGKGHIPGFP